MRVKNAKVTVAPAQEPITAAEAKLHCRVDHSTEDAIFSRLIPLARRKCEELSKWAFITRTYQAKLDCWPYGDTIKLLWPPLQSVTSIAYVDEAGGSHTFDASNYVVDTHSVPGRIVLKAAGDGWPGEALQVGGAITITYVAGFGNNPEHVPEEYKQAMLLLIGHLYENRESVVVQQGIGLVQVPQTVEWLLMTNRAY
jgi:uncharacterized phiE125 gp8 family phage protein